MRTVFPHGSFCRPRFAWVAVAFAVIYGMACHPSANGRRPAGARVSSAEFRLATVRDPGLEATGQGALVVRVFDLDSRGHPLAEALIFRLPVDIPSVHTRPGGVTNAAGIVVLGALPAGDYELQIRRLGYESTTRPVAFRAGFVDTLTVGLRPFGTVFDDSPANWP
jgi:hypothetical protein